VACRRLALANALDGTSRAAAARQVGGTGRRFVIWVIRFNAERVEGLGERPEQRPPDLAGRQLRR
jgi:putative transposase